MSLKIDRAAEIDRLRVLEKKAFGSRHGRTDFYDYLEAVLLLYRSWKINKKSKARMQQLAKYHEVKLRKNTHPIRAIIDASSEKSADVRSRWTRALQFVARNAHEVERLGVREFIEVNGGIYGCARKSVKRNQIKSKAS